MPDTGAAALASISVGAILILELVPLLHRNPTPFFLAASRTLIICGLASAGSIMGSLTSHQELIWVSYLAVALSTVKLLMEDFRLCHPAALASSLICYGAALILLPKLGNRTSTSAQ